VVVHSFTHGLVTSASITGNRPRVGVLVLVNGAVQAPLAIFLGHRFGLPGVAVAGLIGAALTSLPGSAAVMRRSIELRARPLLTDLVSPWSVRAVPLLAVAALAGMFYQRLGVWASAAAASGICLVYVWHMRPFYAQGLPLDERWIGWLRTFHLLPPAEPVPAIVGAPLFENFEAPR
jgi:hypothetical protein